MKYEEPKIEDFVSAQGIDIVDAAREKVGVDENKLHDEVKNRLSAEDFEGWAKFGFAMRLFYRLNAN